MCDFFLSGTNVTVNTVHPGVVNSQAHRHMPYKQSKVVSVTFTPIIWFLMKPPKDGAQTILHCAIAKEEEGVSGKYYALVPCSYVMSIKTVWNMLGSAPQVLCCLLMWPPNMLKNLACIGEVVLCERYYTILYSEILFLIGYSELFVSFWPSLAFFRGGDVMPSGRTAPALKKASDNRKLRKSY